MTEDQDRAAEDLDLEESDAASVAGGMSRAGGRGGADPAADIASLQAQGYVEDACTTEGTVWVNHKTKHKIMVRGI